MPPKKSLITVKVVKGDNILEALLRQIEEDDNKNLKDIKILPHSSMLNLYTVSWEKKDT